MEVCGCDIYDINVVSKSRSNNMMVTRHNFSVITSLPVAFIEHEHRTWNLKKTSIEIFLRYKKTLHWKQKLFWDWHVCGSRCNWHFWETFEANPIIAQKFRDVSKTSPNHNVGEPFPLKLTCPVEELIPNYFPTSYISILRFFNFFDGP